MTSPSGGGSSLLETLLIELRLNGLGQLTQLQGSLGRATDSSKALTLALAGIGTGLLALAGKAVQAAGDMEQAEASFTTLLKSATKAKAFLGELQQFAANTPFEFKDLQKSAQQMLAYGFSAKQVIPMLTAVGDAAGGQADKIANITRALGQIQAKGKVSAEEMNQLAEAGIPAWEMLAKAIGTTIPEAMKRGQAGTISAMQAIPGMLVQMETKFAGGMDRQSKTLLGIWSNFQDSLNMTMVEIGDSLIKAFDLKGVLNSVVAGLNQVKSALKGFDLKVWATDNAEAIAMVGGAITAALIPAAIAGAVALAEFIIPLAPLLIAGAAIGLAMKRMGVSFDDIRQAVGRGVQTFEQLRAGVTSALGTMQDRAAPILADFSSAAVNAFQTIKSVWERVGAPIWRDIQPIIQNALQGVMPFLTGFGEMVRGTFVFVRRLVEEVLIPAFEWLWPHIKPILEFLGGGIRTQFEWLGALFTAVGQAMQGNWSEAWEGIKTGTIKALTGLAQLLTTMMEPVFVNAAAFGTRIKDGILSGLTGMGAAITESISNAILNATSALPQGLKDFLGISGAIDKLNGQTAALKTGQTSAQNDSAATTTIQALSGNKQAQAFFQAIFGQESKSRGGYAAINPESGALGKYQVMGQNLLGGRYDSSRNTWGWMATHMDDMGVKGQGWDAKALGRDVSLREYINSPKIQEAIAQSQMGQNLQKWMAKFPNDMQRAVKEAALDWYGRGQATPGNPTGAEYADSIWQKFKAAAGVQDTPVGTPINAVARFPAPPAAAAGKPAVDNVQAIKDVFPMGSALPSEADLKHYNLTLADWNKLQGRAMELAREAAKAESDLTGKRGLQVAAAMRAWAGTSAARKASFDLAENLVSKQAQAEEQRKQASERAQREQSQAIQQALQEAEQAAEKAQQIERQKEQARQQVVQQARQLDVQGAQLSLDQLKRLRDQELTDAGDNVAKKLAIQKRYAADIRKSQEDIALAQLKIDKAAANSGPAQNRDKALSNAYSAYYGAMADAKNPGAVTQATEAQTSAIQKQRDAYSQLADKVRQSIKDGGMDADARQTLLAAFNALGRETEKLGLTNDHYVTGARKATFALVEQSDAIHSGLGAIGESVAQTDALLGALDARIEGLKETAQTVADLRQAALGAGIDPDAARPDLNRTSPETPADLLKVIGPDAQAFIDVWKATGANDAIPQALEALTPDDFAGLGVTVLQGLVDGLGNDPAWAKVIGAIQAGLNQASDTAGLTLQAPKVPGTRTGNERGDYAGFGDQADATPQTDWQKNLSQMGRQDIITGLKDLDAATLQATADFAAGVEDIDLYNSAMAEIKTRAEAAKTALENLPVTKLNSQLAALDRMDNAGLVDKNAASLRREGLQAQLEDARFKISSAKLTGAALEAAQIEHEDRLSQIHAEGEAARKVISDRFAQDQLDATAKAVADTASFMDAQAQVAQAEAAARGDVIPQYQSEIDALEKLKREYPELAARIDLVIAAYKKLQVVNKPLEKFQEYAGYVRDLSAALGGLADAAGASDLAANLNGLSNLAGKLMDLGTDVARILANPADIGAWVGAITKVVGGIAEAIGGFQKAKQQVKELKATFQEQFTFASGEDFAKTFVRSRGFLADLFGGGPEVVQEIDKLGTVFAKSMDTAFASGIKDGMKNALMANDFSKFGDTLKETIFGSVVDGLAEAFKSQILTAIIGPAIKAWADALKTPGTDDDQAALAGIKAAVGEADQIGQAYYSQVAPLVSGLQTDFGLDATGKTGSGSSSIIGAGPSAIYGVPEIRLPAIALTAFTNLAALDVPMFNTATQRLLSAANVILSAFGPQVTSRSGIGSLG